MIQVKCSVYAGLVGGLLLLLTGLAWAGGTVSYADGSPATGAQVIVTGGEKRTVITCDSSGHFELIKPPAENAMIRIKAAGKGYAQVRLPAGLFTSGNLAIILPAKSNKQAQ